MNSQAARIGQELKQFVEKKMVGLTIRVTHALWLENPEDTRFSEVNWIPKVGSEAIGTAGTYEQAQDGIINRTFQLHGINTVKRNYKLNQGMIYITNNVEYIVQLNDGTSDQAPKGFVQIEMDKVTTQYAKES